MSSEEPPMAEQQSRVDGNVLAGPLAEVFAVDVTTSGVTCVGCGRAEALAALEVYVSGPGSIARCPGCHDVMLRVARTPERLYLDLRGTLCLAIAVASS